MKPNQSSLSSTINQDVSSLLEKNYGNLITIIIFALYVRMFYRNHASHKGIVTCLKFVQTK